MKKTINKRVVFLIPVSSISEPYANSSGFQQVREFVRWLGVDLMGMQFMRSNRVVFMPVSYNPAFTFYPENNLSVDTYENTMTGIALSLIEQKKYFKV